MAEIPDSERSLEGTRAVGRYAFPPVEARQTAPDLKPGETIESRSYYSRSREPAEEPVTSRGLAKLPVGVREWTVRDAGGHAQADWGEPIYEGGQSLEPPPPKGLIVLVGKPILNVKENYHEPGIRIIQVQSSIERPPKWNPKIYSEIVAQRYEQLGFGEDIDMNFFRLHAQKVMTVLSPDSKGREMFLRLIRREIKERDKRKKYELMVPEILYPYLREDMAQYKDDHKRLSPQELWNQLPRNGKGYLQMLWSPDDIAKTGPPTGIEIFHFLK